MANSQSPKKGVKRIPPESGETRPQRGSLVPFLSNKDLLTSAFVRRIYVDGGSSSEVMYEHFFRNLRAKTKAKLKESRTPLVGFSNENAGGWKKRKDHPWKGEPIPECKCLNPKEQPARVRKEVMVRQTKHGNPAASYISSHRTKTAKETEHSSGQERSSKR
ncbi:hypothetical protein Tco_1188894 [Tanacetum coccineum]